MISIEVFSSGIVVQVNNADEIITDKLALCSGSICCL